MKSKIACMRNKKHIFSTSDLMNIGQQSYFYKVNKLSAEDIEFVRQVFLSDVSKFVSSVYSRLFSLFSMVEQLDEHQVTDEKLEILKKNYANNLEEELQSEIESQGDKYLNELLNGDTQFFTEEEGSAHFINYICMQFLRTKKQHDNLINMATGPDKDKIIKCANLIRIVFSTKLAANIYGDRDKFKLVLVSNDSGIPFLTCDQPVVNFLALNTPIGEQVEEFGLYYPISPNKAVFLVEKGVFGSVTAMKFNEESVKEFNNIMVQNSHEQIYSVSEEQLQS
ncbi:MAG: DUF4238 domain-containing protein, partial [Colwellia sp.]|nr:DUF4238 domain-containing protein [Colwellia sp.]